jgi:outer membrane protein assembly factor BamB
LTKTLIYTASTKVINGRAIMKQKLAVLCLILTICILTPTTLKQTNLTVAHPATLNSNQNGEATSESWPLFRHDAANSGAIDDNAPVTYDLLWSRNILINQGAIAIASSSPAIVNDVVYIGSDDGYMYAFNGFNGDQIWSVKLGDSAVSSPVVVDGIVYVRDWYGNDYALNVSNGETVWTFRAGWSYSSPAVINGVYYARTSGNVTALNASTGALIWYSELGGNGDGAPMVVNDTIYLAESGYVYALSIQDGSIKWSKDLEYLSNTDNTPTVVSDRLYISCQSNIFYALDAKTGETLWNVTVGASCHSNAVVSNGIVYLASGHNGVFALNALTGDKVWNYPVSPGMGSSIAVAGGNVYLAGSNGVMYVLDAVDGSEVWSYIMSNTGTSSSPSVANGILYIRNSNGYLCAFGKTSTPSISIFPAVGLAGSTTTVSGSGFTAGSTVTATFHGKTVTLNCSTVDAYGHVSAAFKIPNSSPYSYQLTVTDTAGVSASANFTLVDAPTTSWPMFMHDQQHTGTSDNIPPFSNNTLWTFTVDRGEIMNAVTSTAAVVGGIVYDAAQNAFVYALDAYTGVCYWRFNLGSGTLSSPAVVDGVVYIGSDRGVYAINAYTGIKIWQSTPAASILSSPTVYGEMVYVGSFVEHSVFAFNISDGKKVWQYQTDDYVNSSPTVVNDTVYVCSDDRHLYALNATTGSLIWKFNCTTNYPYESFSSSPAIANGIVYVTSSSGNIFAVDTASGNKIWNYTTTDLSSFTSSPIYFNGTVYTSTSNGVYAVNASTGEEVWRSNPFFAQASPAIVAGVIYVGANDGNIYALDAQTGILVQQYNAGTFIRGQTTIANGVIYVGTGNGNIIAIGNPVNVPAPPADPEPSQSSTTVNTPVSPGTSANTNPTATIAQDQFGQQSNSSNDQTPIAPESTVALIIAGLAGSIVAAVSVSLTRKNHKPQ